MTNFIKKERDKGIDIARGLAIILVVVGHSGINQYFWNLIYFFHMPLFFFISGCFFRPLQNFDLLTYIRKLRWNELYKNFVIYSIGFLIISPLLCHYGISKSDVTSWGDFLSRIIIILRFRTSTIDLLGQFWFLPVLFFIHAISLLFVRVRNQYVFYIAVLVYFIGRYCYNQGWNEPYDFSRILYFMGFYFMGFYLYPYKNKYIKYRNLFVLLCLSIVLLLSIIPNKTFTSVPLYFVAALSGIYVIIYISDKISKYKSDVLCSVGKHTLDIFIFHTIVMKVMEKCVAHFGLIQNVDGWSGGNIVSPYWLLFTVFGIVIPLAYIYFKKSMTIHIKI